MTKSSDPCPPLTPPGRTGTTLALKVMKRLSLITALALTTCVGYSSLLIHNIHQVQQLCLHLTAGMPLAQARAVVEHSGGDRPPPYFPIPVGHAPPYATAIAARMTLGDSACLIQYDHAQILGVQWSQR